MGRPKVDYLLRMASLISPEPNTGCWLWLGSGFPYGHFTLNGHTTLAHRESYKIFYGAIPPGMQLDHKCRTALCVNPQHLEPVTAKVNTLRSTVGSAAKARHANQTHCKQGHPLYGPNMVKVGNQRVCRTCRSERQRAYKAKMKLTPSKPKE